MRRKILRFADQHSMSVMAAEYVCRLIRLRVRESGSCSLVLSGGETPTLLYRLLAAAEYADRIAWNKVHVFWGDERFVSHRSSKSNYRLAQHTLLSHVAVPQGNMHRVQTDNVTLKAAAQQYENEIRKFFGLSRATDLPVFDIMLLGMGFDGHTASLFPSDAALYDDEQIVVAVHAPVGYEPRRRISLTLRAINNARYGIFLISGKKKGKILERIIKARRGQSCQYPAGRVRCRRQTLWLVSESSAGRRCHRGAAV